MEQPKAHMVKVHQALREVTNAHRAVGQANANHAERETARRDQMRKDKERRDMLSSPLGKNGT